MLTSKQRAYLRGLGNDLPVAVHIGKEGAKDSVSRSFEDYLKKRELVKAQVLKNCDFGVREAAEWVAEKLGAEVVQVIGRRFILYKPNPELEKLGEAILLP